MIRPLRRPGLLFACLLVTGVLAWSPSNAEGQESDEITLLRRAASLEARGRYEEAREALEEILDRNPTSSGALFSLERVLRPLGRLRAVLPRAERYLAEEPRSAGARYLVLRVLTEVDSVSALRPAIDAWVAADPESPEPWREGARVLEESFGSEPALELLRRGREVLDDEGALALEIGDVLLRSGDGGGAVAEWATAVGPDGDGLSAVLRRVERLEGDAAELVPLLVERLGEEPTTVGRQRAGVRIAVESGLAEDATGLAVRVAGDLEGRERRNFLAELARQGESSGLPAVSLWAWRELASITTGERTRRALDQRIAAAALSVGDTATAVEAQARVARSLPPGSAERRRAVADLVRVEAAYADAETLRERLDGFRAEFPDAPELDELASAVAAGLRARGRGGEAARALEGVDGPRSSLERAYLLFEEGSVAEGTEALLGSVEGLDPSAATAVIQLAALLERLSPPAAASAARASALAHREAVDEALRVIGEGADAAIGDEVAVLLAHGARLAEEAGRGSTAATLRERILRDHGDAPEAAEAGVALARWHARTPEGVERAVEILEALILARPDSPVVPMARRELDRLRGGAAAGGVES